MNNERVVVKFTQSWRGYSKGEIAGFAEGLAKALIDGKVAQLSGGGKAAAAGASKGSAGKGGAGKGDSGKPGKHAAPPAGDDDTPPPGADTPPPAEDDDEPKP